jgi:dihydrofolate reductase
MANLVYSAITSLDGYVNDAGGDFDWAAPDQQVHAFVNELERSVGTYLYGRGMYAVMVAWEDMDLTGQSGVVRDYAELWRAADKVVYSATLGEVSSTRTRLERSWDPEAVRRMRADAGKPLSVGGPTLAAQAFRDGLIDEVHLFLNPVIIGGGTRALPDDVRLNLDLLDEHRFDSGVVHLHYAVRR